jgi:hypothetical protein
MECASRVSRECLRGELRKIVEVEAGSGGALEAAMSAIRQLSALDEAAARPKRRVRAPDLDSIVPAGHWHAEPTGSAWRDLDAHDSVKLRDGWKRRLAALGPWHE